MTDNNKLFPAIHIPDYVVAVMLAHGLMFLNKITSRVESMSSSFNFNMRNSPLLFRHLLLNTPLFSGMIVLPSFVPQFQIRLTLRKRRPYSDSPLVSTD